MKKAISLLLVLVMMAALGGCGAKPSESTSENPKETVAPDAGKEATEQSPMSEDAAKYFDENGNMITPFTSEPVTYSMIYRKPSLDIGTMEDKNEAFFNTVSDLGIKFDIQAVEAASWNDKMNIIFASNSIPDVIWGSVPNLVNYTDQVLKLTDYVENYEPWLWNFMQEQPIYYAGESIGGELYSLPNVRQNPNEAHLFVMGTNKTWLSKLGMKNPTTLEEFTDMLRAFVKNDPNGNGTADEIGIGFQSGYCTGNQNTPTLDFVRVFFGLINDGQNYSQDDIMVENGKVIYCPEDQRYYDMLQWLHQCYEEGLLDKDGFIQSENDFRQKGADNRYGFAMGGCYITDSVGVNNGGDFDYFVPVQDNNGNVTIPIIQTPADFIRHVFTISKDCKNPEYLLMMWNYINQSDDLKSNLWYGIEGELEIDEATGREAADSPVGWWWTDDNGTKRRESNQNYYPNNVGYSNYSSWRNSHTMDQPAYVLTKEWDDNRILSNSIQYQYSRDEIYTPYYYKEMFPYGEMSLEITQKRAEIKVELFGYVENFFADAVINGIDEGKWNNHLKTLKTLGVDEYLEDYQSEYEYLKALQ